MVEGECGTMQGAQGVSHAGIWARPLEHNFWGSPSTVVTRRMKVCYQCGLMLLFVEDPTIFRPKTGTETLPRPAISPEPDVNTLPRPAHEPEPNTETLPRPADRE